MEFGKEKVLNEFLNLTKEVFPRVYEAFLPRIEEASRDCRVLAHFENEVSDNPTEEGVIKLVKLAFSVEDRVKKLLLDIENAARKSEDWDDDEEDWDDENEEDEEEYEEEGKEEEDDEDEDDEEG